MHMHAPTHTCIHARTHTHTHTHTHTQWLAETGYWYQLGRKYCEKKQFYFNIHLFSRMAWSKFCWSSAWWWGVNCVCTNACAAYRCFSCWWPWCCGSWRPHSWAELGPLCCVVSLLRCCRHWSLRRGGFLKACFFSFLFLFLFVYGPITQTNLNCFTWSTQSVCHRYDGCVWLKASLEYSWLMKCIFLQLCFSQPQWTDIFYLLFLSLSFFLSI